MRLLLLFYSVCLFEVFSTSDITTKQASKYQGESQEEKCARFRRILHGYENQRLCDIRTYSLSSFKSEAIELGMRLGEQNSANRKLITKLLAPLPPSNSEQHEAIMQIRQTYASTIAQITTTSTVLELMQHAQFTLYNTFYPGLFQQDRTCVSVETLVLRQALVELGDKFLQLAERESRPGVSFCLMTRAMHYYSWTAQLYHEGIKDHLISAYSNALNMLVQNFIIKQ